MRKLPKDFLGPPLGLGKYKQSDGGTTASHKQGSTPLDDNGVSLPKVASPPTILNLPGSSQMSNDGNATLSSPRAPTQDLDTINL